MRSFLQHAKRILPADSRTRSRRFLAGVPLLGRLATVPLCPWRVGFVVGGTQKGGTTALHAFLAEHPQVAMARGKEAHFFDQDDQFPAGTRPDVSSYHRLFAPTADTRILGDATPAYLYWEQAPARAAAYNPRMKWVLLLRQPADRAYSAWNMERRRGVEPLPFEDAIAAEPGRLLRAGGQCRMYAYLDRGRYARQLRRLFAVVPRRQVLVLRSEDLLRDHGATVRRVFDFLGVDPSVRIGPARYHELPYEAPLAAPLRRMLTDRFAEDIADLERLLGWDLSEWRAG
jgi:hypothetical protein